MKVTILLFVILFLTSCSNVLSPCHNCKGLSSAYQSRIDAMYKAGKLSYNGYVGAQQSARDCKVTVCDGNDYCITHR